MKLFKNRTILVIIFFALSFNLTSCKKENPSTESDTWLIGTWASNSVDATSSILFNANHTWSNSDSENGTWSISGNVLILKGLQGGVPITNNAVFIKISQTQFQITSVDGNPVSYVYFKI